jgi:hypothetical protein
MIPVARTLNRGNTPWTSTAGCNDPPEAILGAILEKRLDLLDQGAVHSELGYCDYSRAHPR